MKKKKQYFLLAFIIVLLVTFPVQNCFSQTKRVKSKKLISELREQVQKKRSEGCDVSTVLELKRRSKKAFQSGDREKGKQLLHEALETVHKLTPDRNKFPDKNRSKNNSARQLNKAFAAAKRRVEIDMPAYVKKVICTYAVPESLPLSNSQKANFNSIFRQETIEVKNGKLALFLDERPVFIEIAKTSPINQQTIIRQAGDIKSPFGIILHDEFKETLKGNEKSLKDVLDAGVKWVRFSGRRQAAWDKLEEGPLGSGNYDWKQFDKIVKAINQNKLNIFCIIHPFHRLDQGTEKPNGKAPRNMDAYLQFIKNLIERYDGDGKDDCPGSPVISAYQLHNEINVPHFWKDTPKAYAKMFKATYDVIKSANSDVKIVLASASNPNGFFESRASSLNDVLRELSKINGNVDILDFHWYKYYGDYKMHPKGNRKLIPFMQEELPSAINGYGFKDVEVWFTEVGTYSGSAVVGKQGILPSQNETEQAVELLRRYIYFMANGVKKIFWKDMTEENSSYIFGVNDLYNNIGLIYNGSGSGDHGAGIKKAAYFSYKLMTRKLQNTNLDNIKKIKENQNGVYAYEFTGTDNNEPVWVLWLDDA
jgi:hypothetical protein